MKWLSDMVKSDGNGKVSGKKTTFLLTWLVASGIVIGMAVNNTLGFEVFTAYLVYGVGADAFGKCIGVIVTGKQIGRANV